jgi:hypothetical protein
MVDKRTLEKLRRKSGIQIKVANLKTLEERLHSEGRSSEAFTIRQNLDLLSPNWRRVEDYRDIKVRERIPKQIKYV